MLHLHHHDETFKKQTPPSWIQSMYQSRSLAFQGCQTVWSPPVWWHNSSGKPEGTRATCQCCGSTWQMHMAPFHTSWCSSHWTNIKSAAESETLLLITAATSDEGLFRSFRIKLAQSGDWHHHYHALSLWHCYSLAMSMLTKSAELCRGPRANSTQRQLPIRAFSPRLSMDSSGVREAGGMGPDAFQISQVKICVAEERCCFALPSLLSPQCQGPVYEPTFIDMVKSITLIH